MESKEDIKNNIINVEVLLSTNFGCPECPLDNRCSKSWEDECLSPMYGGLSCLSALQKYKEIQIEKLKEIENKEVDKSEDRDDKSI